ncbi:MAG: SDR family NAD(P)-dependent oxidoreductase, partial [Gemmataceae bacterium]
MDLQLSGQAAVVVGGARGIGRAIAVGFAAEGANVGLVDRDPEVEFSAASLGRDHKIKAVACQGDATDYPAMQRAAADMLDKLGRVDHLVFAV